MEPQILQQHHLTLLSIVNNLLHLRTNAVWGKGNASAEELLELWDDWLERELLVNLAVWTAQVGHQDDGLCPVLQSVLDGWDSAGDALGVSYFLRGVEGDVEVDLGNWLVLFFVHCDGMVVRNESEHVVISRCPNINGCYDWTYSHKNSLALELNILDRKLIRKRHDCNYLSSVVVRC